MRLINIALTLLFSPLCSYADGIPSLNPNDVPVFFGILGQRPMYHDAAFKAQEAMFAQTGFTSNYNKLTNYLSDSATKKASSTIDDNTPLSSRVLFGSIGAAYTVGVKKHVSRTFKNPIFPSVTNTVDITPQSQSIGFKISF